jgi:hypothetical protein
LLKGYQLLLRIGPVVTSPAPREVMDSLTAVSVKESTTGRSGFSLTFTISKNGRIQRELLPGGYFEPIVTRVQIVVLAQGAPTILMDGIVSKLDLAPSNEPNKTTFTVTGEDVSLAMDLIDLTGIPYPALPAEARVLAILARYTPFGVIPIVVPSPLFEILSPTTEVPHQQGTDLSYVRYLASEAGYVFYIKPGPTLGLNYAYWGPEIRWPTSSAAAAATPLGETQPALNINMDEMSTLDSMSFSFDGLAGTIYVISARIPGLCFNVPIPLPPLNILRPPLALEQPIPHKLEYLSETNDAGPIRAALLGLAKAAQRGDAVTGSGSFDVERYGRILRARNLVGIRGAGLAFDGYYYVTSVSHDIKRGDYKQSFTVAREGLVPLSSTVQVS